MKKISITLVLLFSFVQWNCFGRFAIVRALYSFVDGLDFTWSGKVLTKFIKTILMWVIFVFPFVGGLAFAADLIVINLIEFWTGKNIVDDHNDGTPVYSEIRTGSSSSKPGSTPKPAPKRESETPDGTDSPVLEKKSSLIRPGKEIHFQDANSSHRVSLIRSQDGNLMTIRSFDGKKTRELLAKRDEPGVFYQKINGNWERITGIIDEEGDLSGVLMGEHLVPVH